MLLPLVYALLKLAGFTLALVTCVVLYKLFIAPNVGKRALLNKIPCEKRHWLLGHLNHWGPGPVGYAYLKDQGVRFKDEGIFALWLGPSFPLIVPVNPEDCKKVLDANPPKSEAYSNLIGPWLGDSLLTMDPKPHRPRRKMLTPAFHFNVLKDYFHVFVKHANALTQLWLPHARNGELVDVQQDFQFSTLDIIGECAFGIHFDAIHHHEHEFVRATTECTRLLIERFFNPLMESGFIYGLTTKGKEFARCVALLHKYADDAIHKRKQELNSSQRKARANDFLDILLSAKTDEGESMSDQELRDEVTTFMFEGHDTTSSGLQWTMYLLANDVTWQKRCRDEVDQIWPSDGQITVDHMSQLKTLDACLKESHRMYSPVPGISRQLDNDLEVAGYTVPAGTFIAVHPLNLHMNPNVYPDPDRFDPERWIGEHNRHTHAYLPFSAGSRNCIGQKFAYLEEKVMISTLLRNFELAVPEGFTPQPLAELVTRNEGPLSLRLSPRKH